MRRKNRDRKSIDRRWLFALIGLLAFVLITVNCTLDEALEVQHLAAQAGAGEEAVEADPSEADLEYTAAESDLPAKDDTVILSDELWADVGEAITAPRTVPSSADRISIDVRDAHILDVFSMIAYKLDGNILYLEDSDQLVTFKTISLSPLTTFQLLLQKLGYDYMVVGHNYIVGNRDRLYGDFTNRMFLTRFPMHYVSAAAMEDYIIELGMPLQSLTVDSNQRALWMQGTPMTLGKARELINTLDVKENAEFGIGGSRTIRMPVAMATGNGSFRELSDLVQLLSMLLDGLRDGETYMGFDWTFWDHPNIMITGWDDPVIRPHNIRMKVTDEIITASGVIIRYLIAEGNPDNIEIIRLMIEEIRGTPDTPFPEISVDDANDNNDNNETDNSDGNNTGNETSNNGNTTNTSTPQGGGGSYQPPPQFRVTTTAVPSHGGTVTGGGTFSQGDTATIRVTAADGYRLVRLVEGGAELSRSAPYSFPVYLDRNVDAIFEKIPEPEEQELEQDGND